MKNFILVFLISFASSNLFSQDNRLIFQDSKQLRQTNATLNHSPSTAVSINLSILQENNSFSIQFDDYKFVVDKIELTDRGMNGYGFWGEDSSNSYNLVHLSIMDGMVNGYINTEKEKFIVDTSSSGQYLISKVNSENKTIDLSNDVLYESSEGKTKAVSSSTNSTEKHRKVRILVLHTAAVGTSSSVLNKLLPIIELTNRSFENSLINAEIELAYLGQTNYTATHENPSSERNISLDLNRFRIPNDGMIDEVHQLRDIVHADVCVLICKTSSFIGVTDTLGLAYVGASAESAFMFIADSYSLYEHVFAHELGHIVGCEHAHSYKRYDSNNNIMLQTIMSASPHSEEIPYWSNYDLIYDGSRLAHSSIQSSSNKWKVNYDKVLGHRIIPDNLTIATSPISNSHYSQYRSNETLYINNVTISGNKKISLKSKAITIGDNFSITDGSQLELSTE